MGWLDFSSKASSTQNQYDQKATNSGSGVAAGPYATVNTLGDNSLQLAANATDNAFEFNAGLTEYLLKQHEINTSTISRSIAQEYENTHDLQERALGIAEAATTSDILDFFKQNLWQVLTATTIVAGVYIWRKK